MGITGLFAAQMVAIAEVVHPGSAGSVITVRGMA